MGIIIEEGEFDPKLRQRISDFIDAFFDERGHDDQPIVMRANAIEPPAVMAQPAPSEPPVGDAPSGGMLDKFRRLHESSAKRSAAEAPVLEEAAFASDMAYAGADDLKSWLDNIDEPFSTTLLSLIDCKGLVDTDVYKRAHMSRQLFSRIRSDASYRPAKKTVLALSIAMELSLEEMRDLLERAGFALSRANKRDVIVEYFVTNGIYDLFAINEALYEFDQPLI